MSFMYFACLFVVACGLDLIPERCEFTYVNTKFLRYATCHVKRYSRRTNYVINVDTEILTSFGNNVTVELVFFERLGNEYKRSFVEMKKKLCNFFDDPYTMMPLKMAGIKCPTSPGVYQWSNMSLSMRAFPYKWPFRSGRMNYSSYITETRETLVRGALYLLFKDTDKRRPS